MTKSEPYLQRIAVSASSTTAEYLIGPRVVDSRCLRLDSVQVIDATTAFTYADLIFRLGGTDYIIRRSYPATPSKLASFQGPFDLPGGMQPVVLVVGAMVADAIEMVLNGLLFG